MHVLIIGGGGREHALAWRLSRDTEVTRISALPGNPGIDAVGDSLGGRIDDHAAILAAARSADLVVIGPEAPIVAGLTDELRAAGATVFGPSRAAGLLEGSKVFSKQLFRDAGMATAAFEVFDDADAADAYLRRTGAPIVVKADGLCAGKGAIVCQTRDEAHQAVDLILRRGEFGAAGERIVIEQCLRGPELSVMALVDGETVVPLPVSQDHKRALDGDAGPNTGGMGAYSPVPQIDPELVQRIIDEHLVPTARAMVACGRPYQGVLYGGYLLTDDGPQVLEYNCRFGDPEAQVVLPRIGGSLAELLLACAEGRLAGERLELRETAAVCVVMASGGYPGDYTTGHPIDGLDDQPEQVAVFHAGTARRDGRVVTAGGRVLGVTGFGGSIDQAADRAYAAVDRIHWPGAYYRRDIAAQALAGVGGP